MAEEIHISLTAKQAGAIVVVLITVLGGSMADLVFPARSKAFTSDDGAVLSERIDGLEIELMEFKLVCEKRYDGVKDHVGRQDERLKAQQRQLSECISRTQ